MDFSERKLHQLLIKLTNDFKNEDFFEYRKERNWEKHDNLTSIDRLILIIKEIKEYKNGYFEEENE